MPAWLAGCQVHRTRPKKKKKKKSTKREEKKIQGEGSMFSLSQSLQVGDVGRQSWPKSKINANGSDKVRLASQTSTWIKLRGRGRFMMRGVDLGVVAEVQLWHSDGSGGLRSVAASSSYHYGRGHKTKSVASDVANS